MWIVVLLILILAAALGVLGTVIKLTAALVLSVILAAVLLGVIILLAVRHSIRRFQRSVEEQRRGIDARGWVSREREPRELPD